MKKSILSIVLVFSLSACSSRIDVHGKYITEETVKQIKIGEHNKNDVEELLGSPSSESTFDPHLWYYLGRKTSQKSFFKPKLIDFKGYAIHFNDDGYVQDILKIAETDLVSISPARRYTHTAGHEMTFWEQMASYAKRAPKDKSKKSH